MYLGTPLDIKTIYSSSSFISYLSVIYLHFIYKCCCLLLKRVTDSHQFKPTDVFTGNHICNTNATKNTEQF